MNKKKPIFPVLLLCLVSMTALGVDAGMEDLSDELQLTADQKARLEAIFNEKHEKYRAIREETQAKIRAVLSEEQLENWSELKRQRFDRRHGSLGGRDQ